MFKVPTKELAERRRGGKVRQANALIRSKQPLDLMQKRLFYVILETVRTTDTQLSDVEFPVPLLKELLNGSYGSFQADLFSAATGLVGTSFSVLKPSGSWATTPIFDRIEYLKAGETNDRGYKNSSGEDVVRARLHGDLEKYLLKLERNYSTQDLVYVLTIPRVRSHRLYEILLHESWRGERPEFDMPVDELQSFLGIEDTYKRWQDFKRTLSRQREIIHKFTDLHFDFEGRRSGRAVTHVRFHVSFVKSGVQGTLELTEPHRTIEEIQLANELKEAGYSQDPYAAIEAHGAKKVRKVLGQAKAARKASLGTKNEIRNLGGFIHYRLQHADAAEEAEAGTKPPGVDLEVVVDAFLAAFEEARDEVVARKLSELTAPERQRLVDRAVGLMNAFDRNFVATNEEKRHLPTVYRALLKHDLIDVSPRFKSARSYYAAKDFGYGDATDELVYARLPE